MTVKDIQNLYDYDQWANKKLFTVIAQLQPSQFMQNVGGSYGSIRNTLVHTMSTEWGWLERCGGHQRGPALKSEDYSTLDSIVVQWDKVQGWLRELLSKLTDADLLLNKEYVLANQKQSLPIGEMLHHGANHSVHHRGQVALLLRMMGYAPGNFDIVFYYLEKHAR